MAMTDDELRYWGDLGRLLTPETVRLVDSMLVTDPLHLWNVIGALEGKVRDLERRIDQP